jgi:acyl carrier protein
VGSVVLLVALLVVGFVGLHLGLLFFMASKAPRAKPPGAAEFQKANLQILSYKGVVGFGNTSEAASLAQEYSKSLKILRATFFSEGKKNSLSISKGEFLTYCHLNDDSCVFLVHVPELRRFTADAQKSMSDLAWRNAQHVIEASGISPRTLAVGVKGAVLYDSVMVGHPVPGSAQADGITERSSGLGSEALLYRFFAPTADRPDKTALPTLDRVRAEVAEILNTAPDQIDPQKPLAEQGADELDIVEIVMALEEAFSLEIPDSTLGGTTDEIAGLSVQKLVEIISKEKQPKPGLIPKK